MTKAAQHPDLLTSFAWPTQDMSPEECVYTHDPTGLNILKKGCAHYCNQTFQVSLGGHPLLPGAPSWAERAALLREMCRPQGGRGVPEGPPHPSLWRRGQGAVAAGSGVAWGRLAPSLQKPDCCRGFFGPDCAQCPGGFSNPCYGKGNVSPLPRAEMWGR